MTVDDNYIGLEINLSGIIDNYDDIASIAEVANTTSLFAIIPNGMICRQ